MKQRILFHALIGAILAAALVLGGCSAPDEDAPVPVQGASDSAPAEAETGGTVRLAYVEWDSCVAGTNLVKAALEKAGFKPEYAEITMKPESETELAGDEAARMQKLLDALESLDDVQDVYTTAVMPE